MADIREFKPKPESELQPLEGVEVSSKKNTIEGDDGTQYQMDELARQLEAASETNEAQKLLEGVSESNVVPISEAGVMPGSKEFHTPKTLRASSGSGAEVSKVSKVVDMIKRGSNDPSQLSKAAMHQHEEGSKLDIAA